MWLWRWISGFLLLPPIEKKDLLASDVNSGMKILSQGRRHKPKTCLIGMPRNAFRLTPSFVTVACPIQADSHAADAQDFDIEQ